MFAPAARVAEDDLDIAGEREDRELVRRRVSMLAGLMVARVSVSSRCGPARCDGGSARSCRALSIGSRRWRNVGGLGMTRNHGCDIGPGLSQATRDSGCLVSGFLARSAFLRLGGS